MRNLSNISINELRAILTMFGLKKVTVRGGHEKWGKPGMKRPITIQTHIEPIPEFVVKNAIRNLGITRQEFLAVLERL